jgi:hypothetical protein
MGAGLPVLGEHNGMSMILNKHDDLHVALGGGLQVHDEHGGLPMVLEEPDCWHVAAGSDLYVASVVARTCRRTVHRYETATEQARTIRGSCCRLRTIFARLIYISHATMGLQEKLLHYNVGMHESDLLEFLACRSIIGRY